ncbi:hypothetical protein ES703_66184 [subsurface metagenome]
MTEQTEPIYIGLRLARTPEIPIDQAKREWKKAMLDEFKKQGKERVPGAPFITIDMPCGSKMIYERFEDIPDEDVPCSCGNEKHLFVEHALTVVVGKN